MLDILKQLDQPYFSSISITGTSSGGSPGTPINNLKRLQKLVVRYCEEVLLWEIPALWNMDLESIAQARNQDELEKVVSILLVLAVYSPSNQQVIAKIRSLSQIVQSALMKQIEAYRCTLPSPSTKSKIDSALSESPTAMLISPLLQNELDSLKSALTLAEEKKAEFEEKYRSEIQINKEMTKKWEQMNVEIGQLHLYKNEVEELKQIREDLKMAESQLQKSKIKIEETVALKKKIKDLETQSLHDAQKIQQLKEELSLSSTYRTQVDQLKKKISGILSEKEQLATQVLHLETALQETDMHHLKTLETLRREQATVKELEEKLKELDFVSSTPVLNNKGDVAFSILDLQKHSLHEAHHQIESLTKEVETLKEHSIQISQLPPLADPQLEQKLLCCQEELDKVIKEKGEMYAHFRREQQLMASAWYRLQINRNNPSNTNDSSLNFLKQGNK